MPTTQLILKENLVLFSVKWQGYWADRCNFPGEASASLKLPNRYCSSFCKAVPGCTHYVITKDEDRGDTCSFYNGTATKFDALNNGNDKMSCGVLPVGWNDTDLAISCNFRGSHFREEQLNLEDCLSKCYSTKECSHYNWELQNEKKSICKLMNGTVLKSEAFVTTNPYIVCGIKGEKTIDKTLLPKIGNEYLTLKMYVSICKKLYLCQNVKVLFKLSFF